MAVVLEKVLQLMFNTFSTWWMLPFFCPGNKCEVKESGLCSLPEVNMSKAGHAPEMCFLKHLYIEYLTSSRPGEINQQGITGSFLEPDTSAAACQWCGMLHMQNCTMEKCCIAVHQHFSSLHLQIPPGQHEPPFTFRQLTAPAKLWKVLWLKDTR